MLAPAGKRFTGDDKCEPLRVALEKHGQMKPRQIAGRLLPMACVSLEITQRCNLDCTLCYLSDRAEMAKDVPLPILLGRIDMIASHYGTGTSIQISGGDPTLRKIEELEALCQHIRGHGMRSCFMTNGIKATREMLTRLARAGLDDVAFHVDLTQERKGYATEVELNTIRADYIERAKGLGLRILFNTTVYEGNIGELTALAQFFRTRARDIALISFQMQADTGRGVLRARDAIVTREAVSEAISNGIGAPLDFDAVSVGHSECNRYASVLVAGDDVLSPLSNYPLVADTIATLAKHGERGGGHLSVASRFRRMLTGSPLLSIRLMTEGLRGLWTMRRGLWQSRGMLGRMSILIHNFMDAENLDRERCESCIFMVATENGPLSMCVHNAERDKHIFTPARIETEQGPLWWDAETGDISANRDSDANRDTIIPFKRLKGRKRADAQTLRRTGETR